VHSSGDTDTLYVGYKITVSVCEVQVSRYHRIRIQFGAAGTLQPALEAKKILCLFCCFFDGAGDTPMQGV